MTIRAEEIAAQAMTLSVEDRLAVADRIWESIEDPHAQVEPMSDDVLAAAELALRRSEEMSSGAVKGIPHEEVMARLRGIVACD
jgi:putative addiction module component (TIGR02574 family)